MHLTSPKPGARSSQPAGVQAPAGSFEAAKNMLQMRSREACTWPWPCCLPAGCGDRPASLTGPQITLSTIGSPLSAPCSTFLAEGAHRPLIGPLQSVSWGPGLGPGGPHDSMYSLKLWSGGRGAHSSTCTGKSGGFLGGESCWRPHFLSRLQM